MRLDLRAATFLDPCGNEKYYAKKFYTAPDQYSSVEEAQYLEEQHFWPITSCWWHF